MTQEAPLSPTINLEGLEGLLNALGFNYKLIQEVLGGSFIEFNDELTMKSLPDRPHLKCIIEVGDVDDGETNPIEDWFFSLLVVINLQALNLEESSALIIGKHSNMPKKRENINQALNNFNRDLLEYLSALSKENYLLELNQSPIYGKNVFDASENDLFLPTFLITGKLGQRIALTSFSLNCQMLTRAALGFFPNFDLPLFGEQALTAKAAHDYLDSIGIGQFFN